MRTGRYAGTAIAMLGGLSAESNGSLEWLDMGGHLMTEDAQGVLAHIASRMQRESLIGYTSYFTKGRDEDNSVVVLKASRPTRFPRGSSTVNGYQVTDGHRLMQRRMCVRAVQKRDVCLVDLVLEMPSRKRISLLMRSDRLFCFLC
eukprot:719986-Rhodomonas_salina.1